MSGYAPTSKYVQTREQGDADGHVRTGKGYDRVGLAASTEGGGHQ